MLKVIKKYLKLFLVIGSLLLILFYFQVELSLTYILTLLISFVLNIIFTVNIHELGHLLMGKLLGFKLYAYYLGFIHFDKVGDKFEFSIDYSTMFGGLTSMNISKNNVSNFKYVLYFSAGIMMNLISIPLIFLVFGFNSISVINVLFIVVTIINNARPKPVNGLYTDGYLIKCFIKNDQVKDKYILVDKLNGLLMNGTRPADLVFECEPVFNNLYDLNYEIYRYFHYLDLLDFDNASKIMSKIIQNQRHLNVLATKTFYMEFCFYYSILNPNKALCEKYYNQINLTNDLDALRVKIAVNILMEKDNRKYYDLAKKAKLDLLGTSKMELNLINRLEEIESIMKHNQVMNSLMEKALKVLGKLDYVVILDYDEYLYDKYHKIHKNIILVEKEKLEGYKNLFKVNEINGVIVLAKYQDYQYHKEDIDLKYVNQKQIKILKRNINQKLLS